ncbi:MAG: hypothetical protein ACREE4_01985 [Stellaceae bacterium]
MNKIHQPIGLLASAVVALAFGSAMAYAQGPAPVPRPALRNPAAATAHGLAVPFRPAPVVPRVSPNIVAGPWQSLPPLPSGHAANPLLLNDGTVIVHQDSTPYWWKLTPDNTGSYVNGTWSQIGRMASNYGPRFFGSQVLPDGRVAVEGGEYNFFNEVETAQGANYNPLFGAWRNVNPPTGWTQIGDSQTVVLNNGTYMLATCCSFPTGFVQQALLNAANLTWSFTGGTSKFDSTNEEGWTLLPNGKVLTVDAYAPDYPRACGNGSEIYDPTTGLWSSAGSTIVQLPDCALSEPFPSYEMGPQVLRPDGTVVAFGATTAGTAHTAIFDSTASTWAAGPDLPVLSGVPYILADAPAALLPDGNILFAASPGNWTKSEQFPTPTHFFEFNFLANTISQVADNPDGSLLNSFEWNFLVLPTGQILAVETDTPNVWVYNPSGSPNPAWAPTISTAPSTISRGHTYPLTGTQFNGLSEGAYYGDDTQAATDRPIVAIVNTASGHEFYQRTSGYTISLAPNAPSSTNVQITGATETGPSTLYVIANGISSAGVPVTVQ